MIKLDDWIGKVIYFEPSANFQTEGKLQSVDKTGIIVDNIFIPWHKVDLINLPILNR